MTQKSIQIIDNISKEVLFEATPDQMDLVYEKATEYEKMGLDIDILSPSVSQSLIISLGASKKDVEELKQSELAELESHNEPTCSPCLQPEIKH